MISSGLTAHLIWAPTTFRSSSQHFTVKLWLPQMLPNFNYGRQIMPTDVKKQGLSQMSANRPNIGSTGICFGYNNGDCTGTCPKGMQHICQICSAQHPAKACRKASPAWRPKAATTTGKEPPPGGGKPTNQVAWYRGLREKGAGTRTSKVQIG